MYIASRQTTYLVLRSDLDRGDVGDVHLPRSTGVHFDLMLCIPVTGAGSQEVPECLIVYLHKRSFHLILHGKKRHIISVTVSFFDLSVCLSIFVHRQTCAGTSAVGSANVCCYLRLFGYLLPRLFFLSFEVLQATKNWARVASFSSSLPLSFCEKRTWEHICNHYVQSQNKKFIDQLTSHPFSVRLDAVWNTCCTARGIIPLSSSSLPSGPSIV